MSRYVYTMKPGRVRRGILPWLGELARKAWGRPEGRRRILPGMDNRQLGAWREPARPFSAAGMTGSAYPAHANVCDGRKTREGFSPTSAAGMTGSAYQAHANACDGRKR